MIKILSQNNLIDFRSRSVIIFHLLICIPLKHPFRRASASQPSSASDNPSCPPCVHDLRHLDTYNSSVTLDYARRSAGLLQQYNRSSPENSFIKSP